jgi:hypothetical protein
LVFDIDKLLFLEHTLLEIPNKEADMKEKSKTKEYVKPSLTKNGRIKKTLVMAAAKSIIPYEPV